MKIDSHHHIWDLAITPQDWIVGDEMQPINKNFLMDDYRKAVQKSGIDKTVIVQTVTNYQETPLLLDIAEKDSLVAGIVGWLDVDSPDAIKNLDRYQSLPGANYLKGIRDIVQDHPDSNYLARPQVDKTIKELGKRGLAFDVLTKTPELPGAIKLVRNNPEVQFVLDHISKPYIAKSEFEPWASLIKEIASFENIVCKVSGIVTEANWHDWTEEDIKPYFEIILENFGAERLMYGSDWPVCTLAGNYDEVFGLASELSKNLSTTESESFWSGCVNQAYKLGF